LRRPDVRSILGAKKEVEMPKDLRIAGWEADRPGIAAEIGEVLGNAGVNIEGAFGSGRYGEVHVLVEDAETARPVLEEAGYEVAEEREALVVQLEDRPGAWGEAARKLAEAGVNIDWHYLATGTRMVVAVDDLRKARDAVKQAPDAGG
jgi:hypothetical protein